MTAHRQEERRSEVERLARLGTFVTLGLALVLALGGLLIFATSSDRSDALLWFALAFIGAVVAMGNHWLWRQSRKHRQ